MVVISQPISQRVIFGNTPFCNLCFKIGHCENKCQMKKSTQDVEEKVDQEG